MNFKICPVTKTPTGRNWVSSKTHLIPKISKGEVWVNSKNKQVPKTSEDGDSATWELTPDLLFRGSPVQKDFLAVGANFCWVPAPGWGLSSPVPHYTVAMLSLELRLSPSDDDDIGWVQLQRHLRLKKIREHNMTTSQVSGGGRYDGSGEGPPRNPSTQIAISHHPPLPRTPTWPLTLAIGILLAST